MFLYVVIFHLLLELVMIPRDFTTWLSEINSLPEVW